MTKSDLVDRLREDGNFDLGDNKSLPLYTGSRAGGYVQYGRRFDGRGDGSGVHYEVICWTDTCRVRLDDERPLSQPGQDKLRSKLRELATNHDSCYCEVKDRVINIYYNKRIPFGNSQYDAIKSAIREGLRVLYDIFESTLQEFSGSINKEGTSILSQGVLVKDDDPQKPEGEQAKPMETRNLIVFGAPGTGKSHKLERDRVRFGERYERVTFYPTYSYAQFVGTYKPVMRPSGEQDASGRLVAGADGRLKEEISYEFVPGPFLRILVDALIDPQNEYCLIIEEINRANAAAVFGDVFQLLDRDSKGASEYLIAASEDVKKYLKREITTDEGRRFLGVAKKKDDQGNETDEWDWDSCSLRIPKNMYIWATMNSADQGVFPMDTAFKRRWEFEYISIDDEAKKGSECLNWTIEGKGYSWNDLRRFINGLLSAYDVNEDKLMGPYFVKADNGNTITKKLFDSKVLMYLWEDAARMIRKKLFGEKIKTYSQLVTEWNKDGVKMFEMKTLPNEVKDLYVTQTNLQRNQADTDPENRGSGETPSAEAIQESDKPARSGDDSEK